MPSQEVEFSNADDVRLHGVLEIPDDDDPIAYALFAHCFTCGKDVHAARRISRALAERGFAVLRFDFTGVGHSDGEFEETGFASNVQDLVAAAVFLAENYAPVSLLVGHSLGGTAALAAASQIPSIRAVATVGAPATASHVRSLIDHASDEIRAEGSAEVRIGGRSVRIGEQLLEDLDDHDMTTHIGELGLPLIVFHSPRDGVVSVDEAGKIFKAARHPKSFVSLDSADHLLSDPDDSEYVASTLAAWASRYV